MMIWWSLQTWIDRSEDEGGQRGEPPSRKIVVSVSKKQLVPAWFDVWTWARKFVTFKVVRSLDVPVVILKCFQIYILFTSLLRFHFQIYDSNTSQSQKHFPLHTAEDILL